MRSKKQTGENYLDKVPLRSDRLKWSADEHGMVTLDIENKGIANRIAQLLLKKPKISHIHLDEMGSFIWQLIDGENSVADIAVPFAEHFGDKALPLHERICEYFRILDSYGFVGWKQLHE
ncbi:MAG: PqqD family protein [Oscillospiraceae bacterium]